MKRLHLICNSHLDPVWQWDWNEGIAATIATFYQAANFLDEFDYVFCHGEAILYEWIEKYDKELFDRIVRYVKEGKWHIMGGFYLQPDCNVPSGESFVRQIKLGKDYFMEKFGVEPKVALNLDSFGHSIGMPQILAKTGYEGYLFCRPERHDQKEDLREFIWRGKDGSEIKAARCEDESIYCSRFGYALEDVKRKMSHYKDMDIGLALWGVGNHGGINSRVDLLDLTEFIANSKDVEVIHSTPIEYFRDIKPTKVVDYSLQPKLKGSYSSMSRIKMIHQELETMLDRTERITSLAYNNGLLEYDEEKFKDIEKALAKIEFHDVLAGTCCQNGETSSLNIASGAMDKLYDLYNDAFFMLIKDDIKAVPFEFPVFVFNHQPYARKALIEVEILIDTPLDSETLEYAVDVKKDGKIIESQIIKELGNINFDRRKRVAFFLDLKPLDITRVDLQVRKQEKRKIDLLSKSFEIIDKVKTVRISKTTGLIESFNVNGKELLKEGSFEPMMFDSTPNPWGHFLDRIDENGVSVKLSNCDKGVFKGYKNVRITESGEILTRIESLFEKDDTSIRISYIIPKDEPYIDIEVDCFYNEQNKSLRLKVSPSFDYKIFVGTAFSQDEIEKNGFDNPCGRFISMNDGSEKSLHIFNDGVFDILSDDSSIYPLLLNGAAYCAHLVGQKPIIKESDRFIDYIEQGKHHFKFRMSYDDKSLVETKCDEFLNRPFALNCYPHGKGIENRNTVLIDNMNVTLKAMFKHKGKTVIHILNNTSNIECANIKVFDKRVALTFKPFEVKTLFYDGNLEESVNLL